MHIDLAFLIDLEGLLDQINQKGIHAFAALVDNRVQNGLGHLQLRAKYNPVRYGNLDSGAAVETDIGAVALAGFGRFYVVILSQQRIQSGNVGIGVGLEPGQVGGQVLGIAADLVHHFILQQVHGPDIGQRHPIALGVLQVGNAVDIDGVGVGFNGHLKLHKTRV